MNKPLALILLFGILSSGALHAQGIQVNFDDKVIYTDSLNLPDNTTAYSLLTLLPEMLQRPGESYLSNYDVKVDGMSVSQVRDVALNQLMIDDIERIEVSESPLDSYNKNGVGGSIDLVLRSHGQKTDKIWGSVGVNASYPLDIAPQLILGHRSDKVLVRGLVMSEFYENKSSSETVNYDAAGMAQSTSRSDYDYRYGAELARLYLLYSPTQKDELKLNLSESYQYTRLNTTPDNLTDKMSNERSSATTLHALVNYKHYFSRGQVLAEMQYIFTPGDNDRLFPEVQRYRNDYKNHNLSGKVEVKTALLPTTCAAQMNLSVGSNLNGCWKANETRSELLAYSQLDQNSPQNNTFFVLPYLTLDLSAGKFRMKGIFEYQYFRYDIHRLSDEYSTVSHDFTGKLMAEYHFTQHQNLRLIVDRKIQRPSEDQLYPMLNYSLENMTYLRGNPALTPVLSHEVKLDYISDYQWREHSLIIDAALSYNNIRNIISSVEEGYTPPGGMLGQTLTYTTYENGGVNHIINANAMALYRFRAFSLSFSGNVYHKEIPTTGEKNHYTYYNLSLHPQFTLSDGWHGGAKITYYSRVLRKDNTLGDCATAMMSVGKRWKGLFVYVFDIIAMQKSAKDIDITDTGTTETNYEMVPNTVGMGIKYTF